ncbi:tyrosine-type recombinase/integrase [Magnetovibrio blakemorei]|uniref:tyrosine-type recombinase/integrase n=1 Tax=Magnetovibrio blakemorei TaxID=28181 RepID=UPI001FDFE2DE|nr:tyrosine-type recombinase/integrase [Magnetovibrio blakemorei]
MAEAKRTAEELYDELSYKQKNNELLRDRTFKQLADEYLRKAERETIEGRLSKGRLGLVAGTLRRYLVPFFGKRLLNEITAADFNEYDDWRLDYWTRGYGAEKRVATCAKTPSAKTLLMEQGILRQVLKYGLELGLLKHMPFMRTKTAKTNRRSAFDVGEYAKLIRAAHRRAELEQHSRVKRDRKLLELYLRLMVGTGLRVGEARGLKWSDVEFINTGNRKQTETLRLWVDGKTGRRAVIGTRAAKQTIKKLLGFYEFENIDAARLTGTALFTKVSGKARHTFELGFKALLDETGLTWDRYSKRRTLYSLRHTYATFRLLYGGTDIYLLSRNMGTSVEMIEKHYGQVRTTLAAAALI